MTLKEEIEADVANRESYMVRWDQIRAQLKSLPGSDLPRMNFESILDDKDELLQRAAKLLASQQPVT